MIKYVHRFIITIFVVLVTTFASHANSEKCLRALATDLVDNIERNVDLENDSIVISSDGLVEFFTKNIDICRDYLLARKSPDEDIILDDPDLIIDISWDYLRTEVAAALTTIGDSRQLFVCENHRSLQAGIDATLWAVTIVSAIFSGGTGAVVVQGAKVAVKEGIKGITKIGVKKGGKKAIKTAVVDATAERLGFDVAGKKAAKEAAETMAKKTAKEAAEEAAKKFCQHEKEQYTNLTDVQSIEAKQEIEFIRDADGNTLSYNITSFSSPIRIFYTIGNVARVRECPVQPLFENEEFIAAVEKHIENNGTWDEYKRLKDEAYHILFGEKFDVLPGIFSVGRRCLAGGNHGEDLLLRSAAENTIGGQTVVPLESLGCGFGELSPVTVHGSHIVAQVGQ